MMFMLTLTVVDSLVKLEQSVTVSLVHYLQVDPDFRAALKAAGLLTRDPRMKERKKHRFKGARRAPQFSKR